jgi:hypothetical protein
MLPRRAHRPIRPVWYILNPLPPFPEESPLENRQNDLNLRIKIIYSDKIADSQMS